MERKTAISVLKDIKNWAEKDKRIVYAEALTIAINSLMTDEAYQLLYERTTKNDLGVDYRSLKDIKKLVERKADDLDGVMLDAGGVIIGLYFAIANDLPSVTPQPRKGHWRPVYQGDEIIDYRCSECEFGNTFGRGTFGMNFCPRCGSDNREVEE